MQLIRIDLGFADAGKISLQPQPSSEHLRLDRLSRPL